MQDINRIDLQKRIAVLDRLWILFVMSIVLIDAILDYKQITILPILIVVPMVVIEYIVLFGKERNENNVLNVILVLRYIQFVVSVACLIYTQNEAFPFFAYCVLAIVLSAISYYFVYDVFDSMQRAICIVTMLIPMGVLPVVIDLFVPQVSISYPKIYLFFVILTLILAYCSKVIVAYFEINSNGFLHLLRQIESVKETNEALRDNQEKVKKANELLGVQKIKLEAAYDKINNVNAEMMIQNEIIKYISSSLEIGKLMDLITESILTKIRVEVCAIVLYPGAANNTKIKYRVRTNISEEYQKHLEQHIEENCFDTYIVSNESFVDNHVRSSKYSFLDDNTLGSILIEPLVKGDKRIGALYVGYSTYDYFGENHTFFEAIVGQFIMALDNANLYMRMEMMAIRDGLTGIYNRRYLTKMFQETIRTAVVSGTSVSIALFDIDRFKNVNDTYGHVFGDVVIQAVAKLAWSTAQRYKGFVGRYGGEEFVFVFPNKSIDEAYGVINEFHQLIKMKTFEYSGETVKIDVSIGVTAYPESCKNPEELLSRADWAMYYSKQHGRGCITIDSDEIQRKVSTNNNP